MITLKNISKLVTRDDREVEVLSNINLQLGDTGLVVLRGGKDAGKTCLLRMIAQLDNITSGNIFVDGVDIGLLSDKEIENYRTHYVGMVMEKDDILPDLTIEENIAIGTAFGRIKPKNDVMMMLYANLELSNVTKRKARECTDSEKVCANLARLMIKSPKVMLIDDFGDDLEADTMLRVWRILKEISETHLVVIVSDSDPYISKFADRVITMNMGKIVSDTGADKRKGADQTPQQEVLDKSIFLKKHRFTLGATWKILKQMFYKNGKNMILTMVFALLAVICFTLTASLSVFNEYETIAKSSVSHNEKYIEFYQGDSTDQRLLLDYDPTKNGGETIIGQLQKIQIENICAKHRVNWQTNIQGEGFVITSFITNNNTTGMTDENRFGQKILAGSYTGEGGIGNDTDYGYNIVISDYMAEVIIKYGIKDGFAANKNISGEFRNMGLYKELVAPRNQSKEVNLVINGQRYNIIGIYETDFHKYVEKDLTVKKDCVEIFRYNIENVYSVIHVNSNFYSMNPQVTYSFDIAGDEVSAFKASAQGYTYSALYNPSNKVTIINSRNVGNWSRFGLTASPTNDSVYVSADVMQNILLRYTNDSKYTIEYIATHTQEVLNLLTSTNYKKLRIGKGANVKTYAITQIITDDSVRNTIIMNGSMVKNNNTSDYYQERSSFEYLYISKNFETNGIVMPVEMYTAGELENFIRTMVGNGFNVSTLASKAITEIGKTINVLRFVFVAISVVCVCLLILLYIRYVSKLYMRNTKMLGLLRSLGCTKFNINVTISLIAIMSIFIILLAGLGLSAILTLIGNGIMAGAYGYAVSIFGINFLIFFVFMMLMILMPFLISPLVCGEFQDLMPLYMLKYDEVYGKKKKVEDEDIEEEKIEKADQFNMNIKDNNDDKNK